MLSSSWNNSFTLWFVLADVSIKLHPQREASVSPSAVATFCINNFGLISMIINILVFLYTIFLYSLIFHFVLMFYAGKIWG